MGQGHQDVEEPPVCLCLIVHCRLLMRSCYSHENLPQLIGYSDGKVQTPFILLASGAHLHFLSSLWATYHFRGQCKVAILLRPCGLL